HEAEYDAFEMWSDGASHFALDPDRMASSGYSMGGYCTYRLPTLYPDLFGKAFTQVGPPGDGIWVPPAPPSGGIETLTNLWLENARNIPYLNVVASSDELVPIAGTRARSRARPRVLHARGAPDQHDGRGAAGEAGHRCAEPRLRPGRSAEHGGHDRRSSAAVHLHRVEPDVGCRAGHSRREPPRPDA